MIESIYCNSASQISHFSLKKNLFLKNWATYSEGFWWSEFLWLYYVIIYQILFPVFIVQYQMVNPENIYPGSTVWSEGVIILKMLCHHWWKVWSMAWAKFLMGTLPLSFYIVHIYIMDGPSTCARKDGTFDAGWKNNSWRTKGVSKQPLPKDTFHHDID